MPRRTQLAARFWYKPVHTFMGWKGHDREGPGTGKATTQATGTHPPRGRPLLPILQLSYIPELGGGDWLGVNHHRRRVSD